MTRARVVMGVALFAGCTRAGSDVQLADVKRADLVIGVEVTGELAAVDSTDIKPPALPDVWDFKLAAITPEGTDVKVGDALATFDPSALARDLENVQANAEEARTKLAKKRDEATLARRDAELALASAEADLQKKTLKTAVPSDLRGTIELKGSELDVESAKLALDRAKHRADQQIRTDDAEIRSLTDQLTYATHRVEQLQQNISRMKIVSPREGTLVYPTSRFRSEKVKIGDGVWRELVILQVVGLGKMIGKGAIDEVDSSRVAVAQPVSLRLDALPDVQLRGKVARIMPAVHAKSPADPSKIIDLQIAVDPAKDAPLRPGMRFRGQVETDRIVDAIQVPTEAVFVMADGPVAYVDRGGHLERVHLELGRRNATAIEVKAGLAPGDRVSRSAP